MWADKAVFYQIYTMRFCGAPAENDGIVVPRIKKAAEWIPYIKGLGISAVYFCPVFSSDSHGYDTRDYRMIDERLGTNEDFAAVVKKFHENDIKVIIDGVFNHVGRNFKAFADVRKNGEASRYKDWFHIDFGGDTAYQDGFYYEGWEGHYELVKLNTQNEEVMKYLFNCVDMWADAFGIDGLRLDVAYALPMDFLSALRAHCSEKKDDFFIIGETLYDDYGALLERMDSITNYQAYKGLWSSFNTNNMFEIAHTLKRQTEETIPGSHPMNFLDNHDVSRIASQLCDRTLLGVLYSLMFALPGIPCVYYGSEWGAEGVKEKDGPDDDIRPYFDYPSENELTDLIKKLIKVHKENIAFTEGGYRELYVTNEQLIFEREAKGQRIIVGINIGGAPAHIDFDAGATGAADIMTGKKYSLEGGADMEPKRAYYWEINDQEV